jgi:hypothetical protein
MGARVEERAPFQDSRLGREVPAPAGAAEIGAARAGEAASHTAAGYGSRRDQGDPTAGAGIFEHSDMSIVLDLSHSAGSHPARCVVHGS